MIAGFIKTQEASATGKVSRSIETCEESSTNSVLEMLELKKECTYLENRKNRD